jgi:hypothetical protein
MKKPVAWQSPDADRTVSPEMTTIENRKYHSPRMKQPRILSITSLCLSRFCCMRKKKKKVTRTRSMVHVEVATIILCIMRFELAL